MAYGHCLARKKLPFCLERLPGRSMAPSLLGKLKTVAPGVERSQVEDEVGTSRAVLAVEENPEGAGIGTLLAEAGEEGGGGQEEGQGGDMERGGGGL